MPSAIAWRKTVGVLPSQLVNAFLQCFLHLVCTFLSNHTTQCIGYEHPHHIALLFQPLLISLKLQTTGTNKECKSLRTTKLAQDDVSHFKVGLLVHHEIRESWSKPLTHLFQYHGSLLLRSLVWLRIVITHLLIHVSSCYPQFFEAKCFLCHLLLYSSKALKKALIFSIGVWGGVSHPLESTKLG